MNDFDIKKTLYLVKWPNVLWSKQQVTIDISQLMAPSLL